MPGTQGIGGGCCCGPPPTGCDCFEDWPDSLVVTAEGTAITVHFEPFFGGGYYVGCGLIGDVPVTAQIQCSDPVPPSLQPTIYINFSWPVVGYGTGGPYLDYTPTNIRRIPVGGDCVVPDPIQYMVCDTQLGGCNGQDGAMTSSVDQGCTHPVNVTLPIGTPGHSTLLGTVGASVTITE